MAELSEIPDTALALALGMSLAAPKAAHAGRIHTLIAELRRRGVWVSLLGSLDIDLARRITLMESMDRMAARPRTGQTRH